MFRVSSRPLSVKAGQLEQAVSSRSSLAVLLVAVSVLVLTRLWDFTRYSLWGGETFLIDGVRRDWSGMMSYIIEDVVHPPLAYVLLKVWVAIGGESVVWLKLFPILPAIATAVPFLLLCRELRLRPAEINLAFILVALNGYLAHYAQEIRNYSLLAFLATCSFWLFARFLNAEAVRKRDLLPLFLINLALVYTHYFGWIVVGLEVLFVAIWHREKGRRFLLPAIVLGFCFIPWALLVAQAAVAKGGLAPNIDWIPRPNLFTLRDLHANLAGRPPFPISMDLGLLLFGAPMGLWALQALRRRGQSTEQDRAVLWWLVTFSVIPVALVLVASRLFHLSIFIDRYFVFVAIPYLMMVSVALHRVRPRWLGTGAVVALLVWSGTAGIGDLATNRMAWESPQVGSRIPWEALARQVAQAAPTADDVTLYSLTVESKGLTTGDWAISTSMAFYLKQLGEERFQITYARDIEAVVSQAQEHYFWVGFFELSGAEGTSPQMILRSRGYRVGDTIQYARSGNSISFFPVWRQ